MSDNNPLFYQIDSQMPIVSHGQGIYLWDSQGNKYLDGCSGAITCNMGHNHPAIKQAMQQQLDNVAFSYRTQFESNAAIELAQMLVDRTHGLLDKVFFVGSGSEAVESAMKLARQYFFEKGEHQRQHFVSLAPSYHGSTLGALSLTSYQPLEAPFTDITQCAIKVPSPDFYRYSEADIDAHINAVLTQTRQAMAQAPKKSIAAFVLEPVGGASTGARMLNQTYFDGIKQLCDEHGCLLIIDEVLSGAGRTGKWLAYQHYRVQPDIIAMAKGLGAGYYPVAAMLARKELVDVVMQSGGFQHGHTYAGNPLACATGVAVLKAMADENIVENAAVQGVYLRQKLEELADRYACIGQVRGIGLLQGIEFVCNKTNKQPWPAELNVFAKITAHAKQNGLLVYPRRCLDGVKGDHILITPPLTITTAEIDELIILLDKSIAQLELSLANPMLADC
jgi:adenosylmethionine-8-amino-7-oxononanoate aminotransferase